jgi:acyl carrier protein
MTEDDEVVRFIVDELGWPGEEGELTASTPLVEVGAIDSLGMYQLATWIEERFDVEIAAEEFTALNFGTIAAITTLVRGKADASR